MGLMNHDGLLNTMLPNVSGAKIKSGKDKCIGKVN
jgi:hypothetical protein